MTEPEVRRKITIRNTRGLHARASGKLAKMASGFDAEIWVMKDDMVVTAESLMGLMMLSASPGTIIELWARGPEAEPAIAALVDLIEVRGFDEDLDGEPV